MKNTFMAIALAAAPILAANTATAQQQMPCEDYETIMNAFEEQGTVFRGTTEGPNHRIVEIFENVATGRGIAIFHDRENSRACAVAAGFDYAGLAHRASIRPPTPPS
jgi:hypothetical protein